jgi:hypothetical protein
MEQTKKTQKVHDLAIGFFGWFVIGNLVLWLWFSIFDYLSSNWNLNLNSPWIPYLGVPLVTIVAIGILFFLKRSWFAYGILAAVLANTLIMAILVASALSPSAEWYLYLLYPLRYGVAFPLPLGFVAFMQ